MARMCPKAYELKTSYSIEQRDSLINADVVVATPLVAATLSESEIKKICLLKWWNLDWDWLKTNSEKFSNIKNII